MTIIKNQEFGGERPLYYEKDLQLEGVIIHAGESSLKETANITALRCRFEGKYPFWCCNHFVIRDCIFTVGARAALWYSRDVEMTDTIIDAPKMFREMEGIKLRNVQIPGASETFWHCGGVDIDNVVAERADYIFMHCHDMVIRNFNLSGNYSFQWTRDVEIHNSILNTKDAFWEIDNVRVYDSVINGEFLGWHSRGLHLVRCHITGSQPLCYAEGLVLEDCTFGDDANLAFEYSDVKATIKGHILSVKNPRTGHITADSIGEIIRDGNAKAPNDCIIETR
jgi:hypothetical protein